MLHMFFTYNFQSFWSIFCIGVHLAHFEITVTVEVVPAHTMKTQGEQRYNLTHSLPWPCMEVSGQLYTSTQHQLSRRLGGLHRPSLDIQQKTKISCSHQDSNPGSSSMQPLYYYLLRYPSSSVAVIMASVVYLKSPVDQQFQQEISQT